MSLVSVVAVFLAVVVGALLAAAEASAAVARKAQARWLCLAAGLLALLMAAAIFGSARAADIVEIPGVAVFTDERGDCPRFHRVARRADRVLGCWTIGEIDRRVSITWADGVTVSFSAIQFDIYSRHL